MNLVIRSLLLICLLFAGRYTEMSPGISSNPIACVFQASHATHGDDGQLKAVEIVEEEDDEPTSGKKKHPAPGNLFSSFLYAQPGRAEKDNINVLPLGKYFCYSSVSKNILFQVFRI